MLSNIRAKLVVGTGLQTCLNATISVAIIDARQKR